MLQTLSSADKEKIAQLTKMAHDKAAHSKMVVEIIRNRLYSAAATQLLPVMYLIDSIVKNHSVPFEVLFQSRIASDFCIAMKDSIPADDRSSFYSLRATWQKTPPLYNNQVFSNEALQELDDMVKTQLDPAWPFVGAGGPPQDDQTRNRSQQSSSRRLSRNLNGCRSRKCDSPYVICRCESMGVQTTLLI